MLNWLRGWYDTIHMYIFDRETYDWLVNLEIKDEDLIPLDDVLASFGITREELDSVDLD